MIAELFGDQVSTEVYARRTGLKTSPLTLFIAYMQPNAQLGRHTKP